MSITAVCCPNFDLHKDNQVYTTDQAKADAFAEATLKTSPPTCVSSENSSVVRAPDS